MATHLSENTKAGEYLIFDAIFDYAYPNADKKQRDFCRDMIEDGTLAVETILELAISNCGNLKRVHSKGMDFVDGSDAKKAVLTYRKRDGRYVATIGNIKNKTGILRCVIANTAKNKVEFYKFPQSLYQRYTRDLVIVYNSSANVGITHREFECGTFVDLCG